MNRELVVNTAQISWGTMGMLLAHGQNNLGEAAYMFLQTKPTFGHRNNRDGVIDSNCCECVQTVASASIEHGLTQHEEAHVCDPMRQHQLRVDLQASLRIGDLAA
jgi:hypothetical protein